MTQIVLSKEDGDGANVNIKAGSPEGHVEFENVDDNRKFVLTKKGAQQLVAELVRFWKGTN